jgi:hypothetical protein
MKSSQTITITKLCSVLDASEDDILRAIGAKRCRRDKTIDMRTVIQCLWKAAHFTSTANLAEMMSVSSSRVKQLIADGSLSVDAEGRLPLASAIRSAINIFRERAGDGKTKLSISKQETRDLQNRLLLLRVSREEGRSISLEDATKAWSHLLLLARGKFLRVGNKLAPLLVFCKTELELQAAVDREIGECLSELSRPVSYDPSNPPPN